MILKFLKKVFKMSVRAYIVHEKQKIIDGLKYVHEDHEYLWNNWSDGEIFDALWHFMNDMTNDDCIGTIEIVADEWDRFKQEYESLTDRRLNEIVDRHKVVFQTIDQYFKDGHYWITIKLY